MWLLHAYLTFEMLPSETIHLCNLNICRRKTRYYIYTCIAFSLQTVILIWQLLAGANIFWVNMQCLVIFILFLLFACFLSFFEMGKVWDMLHFYRCKALCRTIRGWLFACQCFIIWPPRQIIFNIPPIYWHICPSWKVDGKESIDEVYDPEYFSLSKYM